MWLCVCVCVGVDVCVYVPSCSLSYSIQNLSYICVVLSSYIYLSSLSISCTLFVINTSSITPFHVYISVCVCVDVCVFIYVCVSFPCLLPNFTLPPCSPSLPPPHSDGTVGLWRMRTSYDVSPELSDAS